MVNLHCEEILIKANQKDLQTRVLHVVIRVFWYIKVTRLTRNLLTIQFLVTFHELKSVLVQTVCRTHAIDRPLDSELHRTL